MVRILIIGRDCATRAEGLEARTGGELQVDTARLPAAGLRQFQSTPPDAVVVSDPVSTDRAVTLVAALRERPIGQLIPVVVIAAPAGDDERETVDAWLSADVDADRLVEALEACLEQTLTADDAPSAQPRSEVASAAPADTSTAEAPTYFIEEIDPQPTPPDRTPPFDRESVFSRPSGPVDRRQDEVAAVDEEAIRRKLRAVRHEDYFAILEVRRGSDSTVIREAFHRLFRRFDAEAIDVRVGREFGDEIDEIRDALEDAWAVLGDPGLREAYLEHTTRRS